jgi:hypothetical protein
VSGEREFVKENFSIQHGTLFTAVGNRRRLGDGNRQLGADRTRRDLHANATVVRIERSTSTVRDDRMGHPDHLSRFVTGKSSQRHVGSRVVSLLTIRDPGKKVATAQRIDSRLRLVEPSPLPPTVWAAIRE